MANRKNKANKRMAIPDPKEEFISVLLPLRRIVWVNNFIKKIEGSQMRMPKGRNANTEKFILGLSLCLCLFMKNYSSLMKYGNPLKNYTNKHAAHLSPIQAPLIENKISELVTRFFNKHP